MSETIIDYARCSTDEQDLTDQRQRLAELGVAAERIYLDHGLTGTTLFSNPHDMLSIFPNGVGDGAIGVPLYGMPGGYALSGRGPRWARIACGLVALTAIPIWALTVTSFAGPRLALHTARGAWVAVYYYSFLALRALACAIRHRAVTPSTPLEGS